MIALFAFTVFVLFAIRTWTRFRRAVHAVQYAPSLALLAHSRTLTATRRNHPGYRTLLNTLGPIENFFPRIWGITPGSYHMFTRKHLDFEIYGWDVITYVRKRCRFNKSYAYMYSWIPVGGGFLG